MNQQTALEELAHWVREEQICYGEASTDSTETKERVCEYLILFANEIQRLIELNLINK